MRELREPFSVRLVRGDAVGPGPALLRLCLTPPSWLFAAVAEARHLLYEVGVFSRHRVPCPVISVGNLTVGGTGKTPLVEWLVREFRLLGLNPVVLARGYGASRDEIPDELATLAGNLPGLRCVRDPDRVRGALTAISTHCAEVVVLDDGFQHHRLVRQLDLVAVDATHPFGGGHCLPRGTLREGLRALRRAGAAVVTRADQVSALRREEILRELRRRAPRAALATCVHSPVELLPFGGGLLPLGGEKRARRPEWLAGRSVFAASGIGNPAAFERTLTDLGAHIKGKARLPDHHSWSAGDLAGIRDRAREAGAEAVVTTQKDAVKWRDWPGEGPEPLVLSVRIRFTSGEEQVRERVRVALRGSPDRG